MPPGGREMNPPAHRDSSTDVDWQRASCPSGPLRGEPETMALVRVGFPQQMADVHMSCWSQMGRAKRSRIAMRLYGWAVGTRRALAGMRISSVTPSQPPPLWRGRGISHSAALLLASSSGALVLSSLP